MNAIALFLALVLNGNPTCPAETPDRATMGNHIVQVQVYNCFWREQAQPSHQFVVVSPVCSTYVAQPILIKESHERKGWVLNRFGEFYPASVNIEMMEVYTPPCSQWTLNRRCDRCFQMRTLDLRVRGRDRARERIEGQAAASMRQ